MLTELQRQAVATRLRAQHEAVLHISTEAIGAWLDREVDIQTVALLHTDPAAGRITYLDLPEAQHYRFHTDYQFHAWVKFEARIEAEKQLAAALQAELPQPIRDFQAARDRLLYSEGKRARYATDEVYRRAVTVIVLDDLYRTNRTDWQLLYDFGASRDGMFGVDMAMAASAATDFQLVGTGIVTRTEQEPS